MISAVMMHKTQVVVDPICTKEEANEQNTLGMESCWDHRYAYTIVWYRLSLYHCLVYAKSFNYKLALLNLSL